MQDLVAVRVADSGEEAGIGECALQRVVAARECLAEFSEIALQDLQTALRNLEVARSDLEKSDADHALQRAQLEATIRSSETEAEASRLQLVKLAFVAPREREIRTLQIERAEIRAGQSRKKLAAGEEIYARERAAKELEIKQLANRVDRARDNLSRLALLAPARGSVVYQRDWRRGGAIKEGDTVHPRRTLLRIPERGSMRIDLNLSETDVQSLKVGQTANISVPALENLHVSGRVSSVGRVARPVERNSRVKRVQVVIDVESSDF